MSLLALTHCSNANFPYDNMIPHMTAVVIAEIQKLEKPEALLILRATARAVRDQKQMVFSYGKMTT
jgi:predicted esterase YcpF (UPF0227 family)